MKEDFLHYIWQFKLFDFSELKTANDEAVFIKSVGEHNLNTGPDFFNAQLIIDNQKWAGNVEIHINSSDWYVHGHEKDANYDNVILHVVWENDAPVFRKDNSLLPTIELKDLIEKPLLNNYFKLFSTEPKWINCQNNIAEVDKFLLNNWIERLYFERLEQKSLVILELLEKSNNDWETVLFQLLAKNFGLKVNGEAFLNLARSFEFSVLRKEWNDSVKLEALLFGQAGLLDKNIEEVYYALLKNEYSYLLKKHKLKTAKHINIQFFRLRPNNFPTIRIAQLASLYSNNQNLFSKIIEINKIEDYYKLFSISASSFWDTHYSFETTSKRRIKKISKSFIDLLLINTIIPLRFVYLKHIGKLDEDAILKLIRSIKPEKNSIIEKFYKLKIKADSALESQSLLHLRNSYCKQDKCLKCAIGNSLISS